MRYCIVGGGIAGLSLAWYLQKEQPESDVVLVEKSDRLGGWIETLSHEGYLFDQGPRSCRPYPAGEALLQLIQELGIQDQLIEASSEANRRYILFKGSLQEVPNSLFSFLISPLTRPLWGKLWREWRIAPAREEESIYQFAERRLGRHAAETLFDALTIGIFAGDSRQLSLPSCFPTLWRGEQEYGSLTRALWKQRKNSSKGKLFSLQKGMAQLVHSLESRLKARICRATSPVALRGNRLHLSDGAHLEADHFFLALPAHAAAKILTDAAPQIAQSLQAIPFHSLTLVSIGFAKGVKPPPGFGYLVPRCEGLDLLGMVWDSSVFPQQNSWPGQSRFTAMLRASCPHPEQVAVEALRQHLGIQQTTDLLLVKQVRQAIPQYLVGHGKRLEELFSAVGRELPQVTLLGSSYRGTSVAECIAEARKLAGA